MTDKRQSFPWGMTDKRRSFAWGLEPSWDVPAGASQRWWLVEMEDGEPVRAFLPPQNRDAGAGGRVMEPAYRDSFVQWSKIDVPEDAPAKLAPVHVYMGQRCVLENRR